MDFNFKRRTPHITKRPAVVMRRPALSQSQSRWLGNIVRREVLPFGIVSKTRKFGLNKFYNLVFVKHYRLALNCLLVLAIILPVGWQAFSHYELEQRYELSTATRKLVSSISPLSAEKLTYNADAKTYTFNAAAFNPSNNSSSSLQLGSDSKSPLYGAKVAANLKQGITFADKKTGLSFGLTPLFASQTGKSVGTDGRPVSGSQKTEHVVYPLSGGVDSIYTVESNGLKEDLVLNGVPSSGKLSFSYKLNLPNTLTAELDGHDNVDIYSADPTLFGSISFGDSKTEASVIKARQVSPKNNLVFVLPAPVIYESGSESINPAGSKAEFSLEGNILTVTAMGLSDLHYPATIDPSVIDSSANFQYGGNNEGDISYSGNQIGTAGLTGGSTGTWSSGGTSGLSAANFTSSVAYNNYLYVVGGSDINTNDALTTVQYAPINSDGTVGTWTTTSSLHTAALQTEAVAYNGYLYLAGGCGDTSSGCGTFLTTVQYAPINSDGTVGTWQTTTELPGGVSGAATVAYSGYLYVLGGTGSGGDTSNVLYAPINAAGTVGSWNTSTSFTNARTSLGAVAYNGYLYIMGGENAGSTGDYKDVQYAPINSDGTVGTWTTTSSFTSARDSFGAVVYDGYLYIMGGYGISGSTTYGDTQYAPINSNGSLGTWTTGTSLSTSVFGAGVEAYNGYLYLVDGDDWSGDALDQHAALSPAGVSGTFTTSANTYATTLNGPQVIAYNGFLYVIGGESGTSTPVTTIYAAAISASGSIGTFTSTGMTALTTATAFFGAFAYDYNLYIVGGCTSALSSCSTATNDIATVYKAPITYSNGDIGTWAAQTSLPTALYGLQVVEYNGYVYAMGGLNGSTFETTVYYQALSKTGTLNGSWTTATSYPLPTALAYFGATVYGGYVYVAGGCTAGAVTCTSTTNAVKYAQLSSTGGFASAWGSTNSFTNARGGLALTAANGYLYIDSGASTGSSTAYKDVQYVPINNNGSIGTWATSSSAMTFGAAFGDATIYNGYLYTSGGYTTSSTTFTNSNKVKYAAINNSSGGAVIDASLDVEGAINSGGTTLGSTVTAAGDGYIYLVGGCLNSSCGLVFYAPFQANGTIGAWVQASTTLNVPYVNNQAPGSAVVCNGYIYIVGGEDNTFTDLNTTEYTKIGAGGAPGTWQTATATLNYSANSPRDSAAIATYNGYIYFIGGAGTSDSTEIDYAAPGSNGDIASWSQATSLPYTAHSQSAAIYNGYLYVAGGYQNSSSAYMPYVIYAQIQSNGSLGSWSYTTSLDVPSITTITAYNGFMYATGANDGGNSGYTMLHAAINSNGTIGPWENDTYGNKSSSSPSNSYYGYSAYSYDGYLYAFNETFNSGGGVTFPLAAMPRVGQYSHLVDMTGAGTNGTPGTSGGTFGPTVSKGTLDSGNSGQMTATEVNSGATSGTLASISVCIGTVGASPDNHMQVAIYSDDGGTPGALLANTGSQALTANSFNTFSISGGVNITADTNYWLAFNEDSNTTEYCFANNMGSGPGNAEYALYYGSAYGTWPNPWSGTETNSVPDYGYAIYATVTGSVGTGTAANDPLPSYYFLNGSATNNPTSGQTGGSGGIGFAYELASGNCPAFGPPGSLNSGAASIFNTAWQFSVLTPGDDCATNGNGHYLWVEVTLNDSETATFPDSSGNHSSVSSLIIYSMAGSSSRLRGGATFSNGSLQTLYTHP